MSPQLRPYLIGVAVSVGLTTLVVGGASAIGVQEKWFGSLFLLCVVVGCFTGYRFLLKEFDREKRR